MSVDQPKLLRTCRVNNCDTFAPLWLTPRSPGGCPLSPDGSPYNQIYDKIGQSGLNFESFVKVLYPWSFVKVFQMCP